MSVAKKSAVALIAWCLGTAYAHACPLVGGLVDFNCDGKHRIAVTGDSVVFGTGDELNNNQGGYVLRLKRAFPSSQVYNFGYPGITTAHLLSYYKKLFTKDPNNDQISQLGTSDIVIIDVGRNDYFNRNSSTLTATTIKRLTIYLSTELEKRFGTSPLFVTTVLPLTRREIDLGFIKQVNMVLLKIRGRDFPAYLRFDKLDPTLLGADGLHPTSAGYDVLGTIATAYIKRDAQKRSKALRRDSDHDGMYDVFERDKFQTSPRKADTDGDGLIDGEEVFTYDTDPASADTDGDGIDDKSEIDGGSDPKVPDSEPTPTPTPTATPTVAP
jgi:lysophospholipase L1-like esterase